MTLKRIGEWRVVSSTAFGASSGCWANTLGLTSRVQLA